MHVFSVSPQQSPCPIVIDPPGVQRCCVDLGGGCQEADGFQFPWELISSLETLLLPIPG